MSKPVHPTPTDTARPSLVFIINGCLADGIHGDDARQRFIAAGYTPEECEPAVTCCLMFRRERRGTK